MASVGLSGRVAARVNDSDKNLGPTATYVTGALRGIFSWRNTQVLIRHDDGPEQRLDLTLACVANAIPPAIAV